ncbi:hypothetical protein TNCV_96041, partial [Trichonephila clavipes]
MSPVPACVRMCRFPQISKCQVPEFLSVPVCPSTNLK